MAFKHKSLSILTILTFVLGYVIMLSSTAKLMVTNKSTQEVLALKVSLKHIDVLKENLQIDQSVEFKFKIKTDDHYNVTILFKNGTKINKSIGYLTRGVDSSDKIIILDSDIEMTSLKSMKN